MIHPVIISGIKVRMSFFKVKVIPFAVFHDCYLPPGVLLPANVVSTSQFPAFSEPCCALFLILFTLPKGILFSSFRPAAVEVILLFFFSFCLLASFVCWWYSYYFPSGLKYSVRFACHFFVFAFLCSTY